MLTIGCEQKLYLVRCMHDCIEQYCSLLNSGAQLDYCRQADSLTDLLTRIKQLWHCADIDDSQLLAEIARLNAMPLDGRVVLAGMWLPYCYQPRQRLIKWLLPQGHPSEPFLDEYIARCRQILFNQIIQPRTSLQAAVLSSDCVGSVLPAGFIFHLSRCGSTLVSTCLGQLDAVCVLSESPLLTDLLLDASLTVAEKKQSLRLFVDLQAAAFPQRQKIIIKWNAWDIFNWALINDVFRDVPAIFLLRNPVEILASHQQLVGRHMAGDTRLYAQHQVFKRRIDDMLAWRIDVLENLLVAMASALMNAAVRVVDYAELNMGMIDELRQYFELPSSAIVAEKIFARMQYHSKLPSQLFAADIQRKQTHFTSAQQRAIEGALSMRYQMLLNNSQRIVERV